jgi:pyruvate dehydrogenase E2 component (dihydrolipoamide acetyltransferase)
MPINILMPALSPTMEKGNVAKWLKKEGDKVKSGDVLAEIETDKATMEVEAIDEGTLAKIVVPEGTQDVPVNQLIAVLASEGEDVKAASAAGEAAPSAKPAPQQPAAATPQPAKPAPQPAPSVEKPASAPPSAQPAMVNGQPRVFSSPLARRLAKDAGIDIGRVQGSGPHGRVVARDIAQAKAGGAMRAPAVPGAAAMPAIQAPSDQAIAALYEPGSYEVVPHEQMRKIIAQRLTLSKQTIPHFYLTVVCDIDRLLQARGEINAAAPQGDDGRPKWKVSVNDMVIKAMALALMKVPEANVTWTEAAMLKHKHADIGVAVAIKGGLLTPIIRKAEIKSLSAISIEMKDLAGRARNRRLKPEEYQGGATSISNLGMYGVREFAAVINPPNSTILSVGMAEQVPAVRDGKIVPVTQMALTLATDHRAVDGALGAELIGALKHLIEHPVAMLA